MGEPIERFVDPLVGESWGSLGVIRRTQQIAGVWTAEVELGYPVEGIEGELAAAVRNWLGTPDLQLDLSFRSPDTHPLPGVKNVIAVASGKGGVGKSTIAVNLALALARAGAKSGLLDADIYGPSQGRMLGIPDGKRPEVKDGKRFVPIRAHGINAMSMSMLVTDRTPMVWRGPMASSALQQLLKQSDWGNLDYLIVDMPPGTGDIQLTLSQAVPLAGAVIVTTPQEIALADARKGIEMFAKVSVPIVGIIENMSYFQCDSCGKKHDIFDSGGGRRVADEYGASLLGSFPLDPALRLGTDSGSPPAAADRESELAKSFISSARLIAAKIWRSASQSAVPPSISINPQ